MIEVGYLSIAEFAEKAGVSKQAIYKQVNNENSQIAPYVLRDGKKTLIKVSALSALYGVEVDNLTFATQNCEEQTTQTTPKDEAAVDETTSDNHENQPEPQKTTQENQPISTDYIEFLKAQVAELKADKDAVEQRLNATIAEKDSIIKEQSAQLAELAQQVAKIADRALIATAQQQYLTAMEKKEVDTPEEEPVEIKHKKGLFKRLFKK